MLAPFLNISLAFHSVTTSGFIVSTLYYFCFIFYFSYFCFFAISCGHVSKWEYIYFSFYLIANLWTLKLSQSFKYANAKHQMWPAFTELCRELSSYIWGSFCNDCWCLCGESLPWIWSVRECTVHLLRLPSTVSWKLIGQPLSVAMMCLTTSFYPVDLCVCLICTFPPWLGRQQVKEHAEFQNATL